MAKLSEDEVRKAICWCELRASESPIKNINKILLDKEVMDFEHENLLSGQVQQLKVLAINHIGKNFIARVRLGEDGEYIYYELVDFVTGEVFDKDKTNRGNEPLGEFELYCFTIDTDVQMEYGVKAGTFSTPEKIVTEKKRILFIAPPLKKYLLM